MCNVTPIIIRVDHQSQNQWSKNQDETGERDMETGKIQDKSMKCKIFEMAEQQKVGQEMLLEEGQAVFNFPKWFQSRV